MCEACRWLDSGIVQGDIGGDAHPSLAVRDLDVDVRWTVSAILSKGAAWVLSRVVGMCGMVLVIELLFAHPVRRGLRRLLFFFVVYVHFCGLWERRRLYHALGNREGFWGCRAVLFVTFNGISPICGVHRFSGFSSELFSPFLDKASVEELFAGLGSPLGIHGCPVDVVEVF